MASASSRRPSSRRVQATIQRPIWVSRRSSSSAGPATASSNVVSASSSRPASTRAQPRLLSSDASQRRASRVGCRVRRRSRAARFRSTAASGSGSASARMCSASIARASLSGPLGQGRPPPRTSGRARSGSPDGAQAAGRARGRSWRPPMPSVGGPPVPARRPARRGAASPRRTVPGGRARGRPASRGRRGRVGRGSCAAAAEPLLAARRVVEVPEGVDAHARAASALIVPRTDATALRRSRG